MIPTQARRNRRLVSFWSTVATVIRELPERLLKQDLFWFLKALLGKSKLPGGKRFIRIAGCAFCGLFGIYHRIGSCFCFSFCFDLLYLSWCFCGWNGCVPVWNQNEEWSWELTRIRCNSAFTRRKFTSNTLGIACSRHQNYSKILVKTSVSPVCGASDGILRGITLAHKPGAFAVKLSILTLIILRGDTFGKSDSVGAVRDDLWQCSSLLDWWWLICWLLAWVQLFHSKLHFQWNFCPTLRCLNSDISV